MIKGNFKNKKVCIDDYEREKPVYRMSMFKAFEKYKGRIMKEMK